MVGKETDVIGSDSQTDKSLAGGKSPSDDAQKDAEYWKNKASEYERKFNDRQALLDATGERLDKIEQLLTAPEGGDKKEDKVDWSKLENNPEAKPWLERIEQGDQGVEKRVAERMDHVASVHLMKRFVREKAMEHKVPFDDMLKTLEKYAVEFMNEMPADRAEKAYVAWKEVQDFKKEKAEFEAQKQGYTQHREGVSNLDEPQTTLSQRITEAKGNEWVDVLDTVGTTKRVK